MPHLVVGTAGHIDHGKSTLVRALTGIDPDRLEEEKRRGITIDLGFAHWRDGDLTVAFVDVPGHERFVRNMLAGATGIDAALLVVAADESVMPQTREHFDICRLLGVPRGVIALTKSDLVGEETLTAVRADVAELVAGSFLDGAPTVPVSARSGDGLEALRNALRTLAGAIAPHDSTGAARLPVDRAFVMQGFGTVVTGTLVRGRIAAGDTLELVTSSRRVMVRGVQVHGAPARAAQAGERTALNLAGIDVADLARGDVLAQPGTLRTTKVLDVCIEALADARALEHGMRVRLHQGTAEVMARVSIIAPAPVGDEVPAIGQGGHGFARLRLENAIAATRGDRFVLRAYSPVVTIGGGVILDPAPPTGGVRLAPTLRRVERLLAPLVTGASETAAHVVLIAEAGPAGFSASDLVTRAGVAPGALSAARRALVDAGLAVDLGETLVAPEWRGVVADRVIAALAAHHGAAPLSEGLPLEEVRAGVLKGVAGDLADLVLGELRASGRIAGRDRLALAGRVVQLSSDERRVSEALEAHLLAKGLTPPDAAQLAAAVASPAPVVERVLQLLVRQKRVIRLDGLPFHRDTLERLRADVAALKGADREPYVDVATFKNRYGLTRKFAIPLLEYLDRERVTRRIGERRVVL